MPLAARLVPWSIVGLSLIVLGVLVAINPYMPSSPAMISGEGSAYEDRTGSWITGLFLIAVGSLVALAALFRQERPA